MVLSYPNRVDCSTWTTGNGGWKGAVVVMMRAMATLYNRAELELLPAFQPEGDPLLSAELIREAVAEKMGLPLFNNKPAKQG